MRRPQTVLIVDDQEINRDALEVILGNDYDVITADNGVRALELMRSHINEISIVMLDLMMPVMNGYEVLKTIREEEELRNLPVIVMTSYKEAEVDALRLGASDFITKPFDLYGVILARVGRIIELNEGRRLISSAEKDELTGLYRKNFFFEYADRIFRYHPELKMDALVLNIEQFYSVNALHGREFGDSVLRAMGSFIREFLREETAKQVAQWRNKFSLTLPVSVNLSRADVFDPDLTDRLCRLIKDNGLDYCDIKLEVTESAYSQDADRLLALIHTLRKIGFEIEMDDFVAGYSSLNMLSSMPIDVLKMDMSFVRNIENSETDFRLMKLILDIAGYLKLSIVAEGVETEGQLKLLRDADCDFVQGYYFSRPVPAKEFEELIVKERERSVG